MSLVINSYNKKPEYYTDEEETKIDYSKKTENMSEAEFYQKVFSDPDYIAEGDIKNDAESLYSFEIGYFGFKQLREAIAEATHNFHYETDYTENPFGDYSLHWEHDDELLKEFLLHSDSDGYLTGDVLSHLGDVLNKLKDVDSERFDEFKDFINESLNDGYTWLEFN